MNKQNQMRLLRETAILFASKKTRNEASVIEWLKIVFAAHRLGYLYVGFEGDGIDLACIAYRIKDISNEKRSDLPDKESGSTLYVCAVASKSRNKVKLLRLKRWYFSNHKDVQELAYDYRNRNDLRIRRIKHGQIIEA